ncbi:hypothetical protein IMG5_154680 [Ichthyophthirius multifiliis]|uniref:Ion transport domain-containing protein n=1 Tax=Ichthyophthirius multifiliis TaxID=5932 RepID=G0QZ62_ICHMU|nr:hypothetical protein IMG5_154680 [Ichthyophthirius multifiliis]EGR29485.1 hypothetical protein IMG5_154680 [Ichthyophthirius multifiliis]|eukprot:XP_004030721.1 hypothetical protein IMG5_154680 [Ichthyophthirius multifiliis]
MKRLKCLEQQIVQEHNLNKEQESKLDKELYKQKQFSYEKYKNLIKKKSVFDQYILKLRVNNIFSYNLLKIIYNIVQLYNKYNFFYGFILLYQYLYYYIALFKQIKKIYKAQTLPILESSFVQIIMTLTTFYALYADDIRVIGFTPSDDEIFYQITFGCFILFSVELIANCLIREKYFLGFTFFMDFISLLSLIFDVPWLSQSIIGISFDKDNQVNLLKAGRVSKVTTRATKIVRFIRLVRLIKLGKLYQKTFEVIKDRINEQLNSKLDSGDEGKQYLIYLKIYQILKLRR